MGRAAEFSAEERHGLIYNLRGLAGCCVKDGLLEAKALGTEKRSSCHILQAFIKVEDTQRIELTPSEK